MKLKPTLLAMALVPCFVSANDDSQINSNEITPNIVGGITADPNDWKFYTQIVGRNSNRSFCGASYIGEGFVLTAAHCVDNDLPSDIAVKIGGSIYNGSDGVRANVSQIYIHPSYNNSNLSNDIALLKLSSIPQGVTTVEIAAGSVNQYVSTGDWLTVAGLGRTSEGGNSPSRLQEVDVPLVSDSVCRQAGGSYSNVGNVSFCAGVPQGGIDSCQGDSGGPIVINRSGSITQLGIVSWGIGCARPGKYGVYSDIAALRSFVDNIVGTTTPPADNVSVSYASNQTLSSFNVGEVKQHSFVLKNTGNVAFTVNQVALSSSGVTSSSNITQDLCTQYTLSPNSSCSVNIEFAASSPGTASVALNFGIDKTSTQYKATVSAQATDTVQPPIGGCADLWQVNAVYNTGDTVSWDNKTWQAQWWNQGSNPSESGVWGVWQVIGESGCSGGQPPVDPPTEPSPPTGPTPPTDGGAYQAGISYSAGDVVTNNNATYQCKPWPNSLWCGSTPSAYEPGVGSAWQDAWTRL